MALACTVSVEQGEGDPTVTVTAENAGDETVELTFSDGQTIEVVAERDGEVVWRYSDGRMFTQALRFEELDPGERLIESVTWDEPPAGEFEIRAWLSANGVGCTAETTTTI